MIDYFRWRSEDAHRNALNAHCYWGLRKSGRSAAEATAALNGLSTAAKNELLFRSGINFNDLPAWQRRGVGLYWQSYEKTTSNPRNGELITATRRRVHREFNLPMKEAYSEFLSRLLLDSGVART